MNINELHEHAHSISKIIVDKLRRPASVTNIEKAEFHVQELGIPHPRYFNLIPYLKYEPGEHEKENSVIGMLAMLCLDYPVVIDEVLKSLEGDENIDLRGVLAYNLGVVGMGSSDNSTKIDLLEKMLNDPNERVRIFVVRSLSKYADSNSDKVGPLILKALNDKSLNVIRECLVCLKHHPIKGSVEALRKISERADLAVYINDINQALKFQSN